MRKAITLFLTLVLLTGAVACSRPEPTPPLPTLTPSPTGRYATTEQYAAIVYTSMTRVRATWQKYDTYFCDQAIDGESSAPMLCLVTGLTLDLEAQTLVVTLDGARKASDPGYIGAPPAELEALVVDTIDAAKGVEQAIDAEGYAKAARVRVAVADLMGVFDRWGPYL